MSAALRVAQLSNASVHEDSTLLDPDCRDLITRRDQPITSHGHQRGNGTFVSSCLVIMVTFFFPWVDADGGVGFGFSLPIVAAWWQLYASRCWGVVLIGV